MKFLDKSREVTLIIAFSIIFSTVASNVSNAVQFGTESPGNTYVVPIHNNSTNMDCSGALISSVIVATAGHCVLDSSGINVVVASDIVIGEPGSKFSKEYSLMTKGLKIYITPGVKSTNARTFADDIAFITLSTPMKFDPMVRLASEAEIATFKNKSKELTVTGYGVMNEKGSGEGSYMPRYFTGNYSSDRWNESADIFSVHSQVGSACMGDSGGPMVVHTYDAIIIVGVVTAGDLMGKYCGIKESGNYYTTSGVLINRYSNLFFTASTNYVQYLEQKMNEFQAKLPKTIVCVKGKAIKKITGNSPKCPAGYKPKKV